MKSITIKLTSPEAIRAACELALAQGEAQFQVMYKPEAAEDDDYIGADLEEFVTARGDDDSLADFVEGRHSWELWVYGSPL